jgi:hypothetical protein
LGTDSTDLTAAPLTATADELVMTVAPSDDAGARTADRYDWQACMATADALRLYLDALDNNGRVPLDSDCKIVCERHEAAIEEAVTIRRALAAARPDVFLPDLAGSLNNLSGRLADLGRREPALAAIEEAVTIRRDLAARWPDAFQHELGQSVEVLGWLTQPSDEPEQATET